jgi:Holliday junction resolvase-like predicted endonuclease
LASYHLTLLCMAVYAYSMVDLFETIVTGWLTSQGYFVIQNLKVGAREIDILAIKVKNGKTVKGIHVEVQCSSEPVGYLGPDRKAGKKNRVEIEQSVKEYIKKKYEEPSIREKAESLLGKGYEKQLVYGRLKNEDIQVAVLKASGIIAMSISDILSKLRNVEGKESLLTTDSYRFQQLLKLRDDNLCCQKGVNRAII